MPVILDWTHVDSDERFHDLVNRWLLSELNFARYEPGDPRGGADRGWDGSYRGALWLAPELPEGSWMCQAKFTKKKYGQAKRWLLEQLRGYKTRSGRTRPGEIQKAVEAGADYLLLLTQAPLEPDHAVELEGADDQGKLRAIVVVYRAKLDVLLRERPWVCHRFFDTPTLPGLVPEWEFALGLPPLPVAELQFAGRSALMGEVARAVSSRTFILVCGASGIGKTRLMREVAASAHPALAAQPVYFYSRQRPASEVVQDELPASLRCVVVVDDADLDYENDTHPFIRLALRSRGELRLVLVVGAGARASMENRLSADGVFDLETVVVPPLQPEDRTSLITQNTSNIGSQQTEALANATRGNPLLLGLALGSMSQGESPVAFTSARPIRTYLRERIIRDARAAVGTSQVDAAELVTAVAVLTPLNRSREETERVRLLLGLPESCADDVGVAIQALCEGGILRQVGRTYRFASDLIGDVLLADRLSGKDAVAFRTRVLDPAMASETDRVATNLLHTSRVDAVGNVIADVLAGWVDQERRSPTSMREERLSAAARLAYAEPSGVLSFVETVLHFPVPNELLSDNLTSEQRWEMILRGEVVFHSLSTNEVGPPLLAAGRNPQCTARAMAAARELEHLRQGSYDNYRAERIICKWHTPTTVAEEAILNCLDVGRSWLDEGELRAAELAIGGAVTVLRLAWTYETATLDRYVVRAIAGEPTESLLALRSRAVGLVRIALNHSDPMIRKRGAEAVKEIGRRSSTIPLPRYPLDSYAADERRALYADLKALEEHETHLGVRNEIVSTLLDAWLRERSCSDAAEEVLRGVEWDAELAAYRWAADPGAGIDDLGSLLAQAPRGDRWSWWVRDYAGRRDSGEISEMVERHAMLVESLNAQYPCAEGFIALLARLGHDGLAPKSVPPWLFSYHDAHPEYFEQFWAHEDIKRVPEGLREAVQLVWACRGDRTYERFRATCSGRLADDPADVVLQLLRVAEVAQDQPRGSELVAFLEEVASHPLREIRQQVCHLASYRGGLTGQQRLGIFCAALRLGFDQKIAENIIWQLEYGQQEGGLDTAELSEVLIQLAPTISDQDESRFIALIGWAVRDPHEYTSALERVLVAGFDRWALSPSSLWHHVPDLIRDAAGVEHVVGRAEAWRERGLLRDQEFECFLRGIGECYPQAAVEFAMTLATGDSRLSLVAEMLHDIPFDMSHEAWTHTMACGARTAHQAELARAFLAAAGRLPGWSSSGGQDPPELTSRLALLQRLREQEPGALLVSLLEGAENEIQEDLARFRDERAQDEDPR